MMSEFSPVGTIGTQIIGIFDANQHSYELPNIFLTNLQSIGRPGKTDKSTELELVLGINSVDIGVCTETWANDEHSIKEVSLKE